jgi:hypothetical protein
MLYRKNLSKIKLVYFYFFFYYSIFRKIFFFIFKFFFKFFFDSFLYYDFEILDLIFFKFFNYCFFNYYCFLDKYNLPSDMIWNTVSRNSMIYLK